MRCGIALSVIGLVALGCEQQPEALPPPPELAQAEYDSAKFHEMKRGLDTRTIVLTYHDMVPKRDKNSLWFDCTPEELEEQILWLKGKGATFLSVDSFTLKLVGLGTIQPKGVLITFADNYEGFYKYAWPILKKHDIPVTMFVHTGHVGSRKGRPKMTWDRLKQLEADDLFNIGSQTVSHPADLTKLTDEEILHEFKESKRVLEEKLGHPMPYLAYPNGKYDKRCMDLARKAGYKIAFSEDQDPAEVSTSILSVNRYVHTKYEEAWNEANGR